MEGDGGAGGDAMMVRTEGIEQGGQDSTTGLSPFLALLLGDISGTGW